jgi:hypothetical protein
MTTDVAEAAPAEKAAPDPMAFEFTSDGPGWRGTPVVNGRKLMGVVSVDAHIDAESLPSVVIRLCAADLVKLGFTEAGVMLDEETREALISLGWTPPPGDEAAQP